MKKLLPTLALTLITASSSFAQDYFSDRNETGTPLLMTYEGGKKSAIFSSNLNLSDATSIKINFYQQYLLKTRSATDDYTIGWGLNAKAKTDNGIGTILKGGEFKPGFAPGVYLAITNFANVNVPDKSAFSTWALILGGAVDYSQQMFFEPSKGFADQLSEKTFKAAQGSLTFVKFLPKGSNNMIFGGSVIVGKKSNYNDLDTYEVRPDSLISGNNIIRHVSKINPKGNTYASGAYIEYTNVRIRGNFSLIPGKFQHKLGFVVFPSVDISSPYDIKYNVGMSVNFLKDGSPNTSLAAIFMEFNDLNNAAGSQKTFLKRSFKIGVSTSLSVLTGP